MKNQFTYVHMCNHISVHKTLYTYIKSDIGGRKSKNNVKGDSVFSVTENYASLLKADWGYDWLYI